MMIICRKYMLLASSVILCLLSLIRCVSNTDSRFIDIVSHFPAQYALLALVLLAVCIWKRIIPIAIVAILLFIFNVSALANANDPVNLIKQTNAKFKVYSVNINRFNKDFSLLNREIVKTQADIALFLEVTPGNINKLNPILGNFLYHSEYTSMGTLDLGLILASNFPILDQSVIKLSEAGNVMLEATLEIYGQRVMLYGVHLQNPIFTEDFTNRKNQFLELAHKICKTPMPVIVAGDLNATPFSPIFREMLRISGLTDSRQGFNWQPSWPAYVPLLWLPIDHVLVSSEIQVHNRSTGSFIGSDHFAVLAELSIR